MLSLLERQVDALRESVRPGGRWDRLASGEMEEGEGPQPDPLCEIGKCEECPLHFADQKCWVTGEDAFAQWDSAVDIAAANTEVGDGPLCAAVYNAPAVVALAREMKALLERLLGEYERVLELERANPPKEGELFGKPVIMCDCAPSVDARATVTGREACCDRVPGPEDIPDETGVSARERATDEQHARDACACPDCGGGPDGVHGQETRASDGTLVSFCINPGEGAPAIRVGPCACADAAGEAHAALMATLEEMSDVGVETAPLVIKAYRAWREARDANHER